MSVSYKYMLIFILFFTSLSCNKSRNNELLIIPVDVHQDIPVALSEIATNVKAVELELTDESMIGNWRMQERVLILENYIVFLDGHKRQVLLFDNKGKFIRQIGRRGQGPGEYTQIRDITADEKNKRIYVADQKIICYDFDGNFIHEITLPEPAEYMLSLHDELLFFRRIRGEKREDGMFHNSVRLYKMDKDLQITDSLNILDVELIRDMWVTSTNNNYISATGDNMYLYYPTSVYDSKIRDALYQIKDNQLIPVVQLKLNGELFSGEGMKVRFIYNIYRSSRFIFSHHRHRNDEKRSYFYYDTQTGKSYNTKGGYTDDLHTGEKIQIRPIDSNAEQFYYLYTNDPDEDTDEEPNPTLYIGTLKK